MHVLAVIDLAADQRDVRLVVDAGSRSVNVKLAELGRQLGDGDLLHQPLGPHAVADQVGDGDHQQPVLLRELVSSGTRAIVPSLLMISQMTPAGYSPAKRARSTAASV